jgi:hypothetical protein
MNDMDPLPIIDPLLNFASKRAYHLNLASAWGTDPDGVLVNLLLKRIEELNQAIIEMGQDPHLQSANHALLRHNL